MKRKEGNGFGAKVWFLDTETEKSWSVDFLADSVLG